MCCGAWWPPFSDGDRGLRPARTALGVVSLVLALPLLRRVALLLVVALLVVLALLSSSSIQGGVGRPSS